MVRMFQRGEMGGGVYFSYSWNNNKTTGRGGESDETVLLEKYVLLDFLSIILAFSIF